MKTLVIHPIIDTSISYLSRIYEDMGYDHLTEKDSSSKIRKEIIKHDRIIMLGHGGEIGMYSRNKDKGEFDRCIINSDLVQFLRDKECIGIWCNANMFAESYSLHGLFSGMIISELIESEYCNVSTTEDEIKLENKIFGETIRYMLNNYSLSEIPEEILKYTNPSTPLTRFNYNNFFYYEK